MMKQVNFRIPLRVLTLLMGLMISISAFAQITVNGNVKDATGEPVIGASVRVVGTTIGTTTDFDGNFTLSNVQQGAKLQVSYVGCQTQEVAAAPNVQVTLQDDSQILNEVVVIGYGVAKKKDLTGSVTALKPDTKNKGVVVSAQDMLMGKVAGVSVVSNGGTPGGSATIRIRGGASLNASNDPLIVVDGVPLDNSGVKGFPNGLGMINPQDIESFNVLKDASATAIYGSRGSNGVIIITTKKGKRGQKPSISYNGSVTVNSKRKTIDVLSGDEYRAFVQEAFAGTDREAEALAALGTANTDWQDEITRTTLSQDHNVQLAGSIGSVLPYRLSLGYTNDKGIIKTSDFKRYTVAANLNPSLFNDHLVMNLNAKWMWGKNRYADGGAINNAVRFDPTQPVMAEGFDNFGGYFEWLSSNADMKDAAWPTITNTNAPRNPVAILMLKNDRARSHSFTVESQGAEGCSQVYGDRDRTPEKAYRFDQGRHALGEDDLKFTTNQVYTVYPDGSIELQSAISSNRANVLLPRLGYAMKLPSAFSKYYYYGRGPINNYNDRKTGQFIELHESTVAEQGIMLPKPQAQGNREEVRWCALTNERGQGVAFVADGLMSASALPYSQQELTVAPHPRCTD